MCPPNKNGCSFMAEPRILEIESGETLAWIEVDGDVSVTLWEDGPSSAFTSVFPDDEGLKKTILAPYLEHLVASIPKNKEWNHQLEWVFEHSKNRDFYLNCFKTPEGIL